MTKKYFGIGSESPKMWEPGTNLPRTDQGFVLIMWESRRYTLNKTPAWVITERARGKDYPPQFTDDMDWLAHTQFVVTLNGNLDKRSKECREEPTWPTRPDLIGQPIVIQAREAPNLRRAGWAREYQAEMHLREAEGEGKTGLQILEEAQAENQRRAAAGLPSLADEEGGEAPDHVESVAEMTAKFAAAMAADKAKS